VGGEVRSETLIVARDPGAASALVPVAQALPSTVIGLDHARPVFERAGIHLEELSSDQSPGIAEEWLSRVGPSVLLTGTSRLDLAPLDAQWWRASRAMQVPSVALLDHWVGYWEKFTVDIRFDAVPDVIAVMDEYARGRLRELGCKQPQILVTGHPAFDGLSTEPLAGREGVRSQWGSGVGEWVVLFVSEPIASDLGALSGYDEVDVLRLLIDALAGLPAQLIVKPHPREEPLRLAGLMKDMGRSGRLETELTGREAVAGADTVVGMTSILLLEAAVAGRPVLSIQPGAREDWTEHFPTLMSNAETVSGARAWLLDDENRSIRGPDDHLSRVHAAGFVNQATNNVCRLVRRLTGGRREDP